MSEKTTIGKVRTIKLSSVVPNSWNPNRLSPETYESLKYGLQKDGWYASQALLIWGSDEAGEQKNIIIDGEHRHRAGTELGFATAPAVVLDGITETKAKSLTIALDQKRGKFDEGALKALLKEIQFDPIFEDAELAKTLGFADEELMKLLAEPLPAMPEMEVGGTTINPDVPTPSSTPPEAPQSNTRMVQLFFDEAQHTEFMKYTRKLAEKYGTANVTDTVLRMVRDGYLLEGGAAEQA